ncbi:putative ABC transporter permease [Flavonifractor sp. An306]|uniref:putative ABC transporter permease n=1 Tax=Flavonifractor sp. An306 TaxID=1965629 RepID=UPI001FA84DA1|nr:putative ABC transporter permease [Flavonifractor sp. An306]
MLWTWGGTVYYFLEVIWKLLREEPERISWTMLVVAIILCVPVERCGAELPWSCPLWLQALACAALVTVVELVAGLILNVWLCLGVWDYSHLPGNLWGQICPQFAAVWWGLCLMFIPVFDWLRWTVEGGTKPHYMLKEDEVLTDEPNQFSSMRK